MSNQIQLSKNRKRHIAPVDHDHSVCLSKLYHPDEATARAFAVQSLERPGNVVKVLYVYPCPICHGWHLTKDGSRNGMRRMVLRARAAQ